MMQKGDFTAGVRLLWISILAIAIGAISSLVAVVLLWLIGFFTNLFYFHQFTLAIDVRNLPSPAKNTLGGLALLIGSVIAYGFTVLVMRRSILTEKIARRGYHVSREYSVDPLERLSVADVMTPEVVTVPAALPVVELLPPYFLSGEHKHQAYPVVDERGQLLGVITRADLLEDWIFAALKAGGGPGPGVGPIITYDLLHRAPITVQPWESCRTAAERMARFQVGRLPVVAPEDPSKVIGIVTRSDLLKPRARTVEEEEDRQRFLVPSPLAPLPRGERGKG